MVRVGGVVHVIRGAVHVRVADRPRAAGVPAGRLGLVPGRRLAAAAGADLRDGAAARPEARMARPVAVTADTPPPARCGEACAPAPRDAPLAWSRETGTSESVLVPPCTARAVPSAAGAPGPLGEAVATPTATRAAAATVVPATVNVRREGFRLEL